MLELFGFVEAFMLLLNQDQPAMTFPNFTPYAETNDEHRNSTLDEIIQLRKASILTLK